MLALFSSVYFFITLYFDGRWVSLSIKSHQCLIRLKLKSWFGCIGFFSSSLQLTSECLRSYALSVDWFTLCKNCSHSALVHVPFSAPFLCHRPFITNFPFRPPGACPDFSCGDFFPTVQPLRSLYRCTFKGFCQGRLWTRSLSPVSSTSGGDQERLFDW